MSAKRWHIRTVWGKVLPENAKRLIMLQKLGFTMKQVPDEYEYELIIDLRKTY